MSSWHGICLAVAAACANSGIDGLRKLGSAHMSSEEIVALVALFDAVIACSYVLGSGDFNNIKIKRPVLFTVAVVFSSVLLLAAKLLYQKALQLSPISLTVPYLSFTPAILVVTAYIFVGETPSLGGLAGVVIVTTSGYMLSLHSVATPPAKDKPGTDDSRRSWKSSLSGDLEPGELEEKPFRPASSLPRVSSIADALYKQVEAIRHEPGTPLMLAVACVWSITATLDKIGVLTAPTLSVYLALQRLVIGLLCAGYLLLFARPALGNIVSKFWLLFSISALELGAVIFFLNSLGYILVSYAVAIKRCGILFSVLLGAFYFKENVWSRMPYIMVMMFGMLLIVLEPSHMLRPHT